MSIDSVTAILRALLIAAIVANIASMIHYIIRLGKNRSVQEVLKRYLEEDPDINFAAYIIHKWPSGLIRQKDALDEYSKWCDEKNADYFVRAINAKYLIECIMAGDQTEYPARREPDGNRPKRITSPAIRRRKPRIYYIYALFAWHVVACHAGLVWGSDKSYTHPVRTGSKARKREAAKHARGRPEGAINRQ